jgi:hypothetical protein
MARKPRSIEDRVGDLERQLRQVIAEIGEVHDLLSAESVRRLYDGGRGMTMREIADTMGRPYTYVRRTLKGP